MKSGWESILQSAKVTPIITVSAAATATSSNHSRVMGELGQGSDSLPCAGNVFECCFCDDESEEADVETRKEEKEKTKTRLE